MNIDILNDDNLLPSFIKNKAKLPWIQNKHTRTILVIDKIKLNHKIISDFVRNSQKFYMSQYFNTGLSEIYFLYSLIEALVKYRPLLQQVSLELPAHIVTLLKNIRESSVQYTDYHIANPDEYTKLPGKKKEDVLFLLSVQLIIDLTFIPGLKLNEISKSRKKESKLISHMDSSTLLSCTPFINETVSTKIKKNILEWIGEIMNSDKPLVMITATDYLLVAEELYNT